ncbi:hypothetical protein BUALT_Bualt15G0054700 [Buddleja alternifolia]|uniref:Uncharacterized protein n=1 Tax=Buddleja alternifolia TaxID=168488 RepID=A0AAV6WI48_9LAMI|nr:hypothetical protein BUALT_Bualt15G0054700 [Buddleja alternifolia]
MFLSWQLRPIRREKEEQVKKHLGKITMYRQSPSRNLRSKGIRVKHVLQICLLLAVCFWLIYQVKHSHDKKKEFDESDAKALLKENSDELIKLGRKDIHSRSDGTISKNDKHDEPIEDEETNGEEDEQEDKKVDDELDEHEQEKSDTEVDREEDIVDDDDKEREDVDDNETQETDTEEDGHVQMEKESPEEDTDRDGDDKSTHEAREEHYKADDASSAVTHDTQMETNETSLEEDKKEKNVEETTKGEDRKDSEVEVAKDGNGSNVTSSETKEDILDNFENGSPPNNTVAEGYDSHLMGNVSTRVTMVNHDLSLENVTDSKSELDDGEGFITEGKSGNSTINVDDNRVGSNKTGSPENNDAIYEEFSNSSNNTESSKEKNGEIEAENSDTNDNNDEISETTMKEIPEEKVEHDSIDISDSSDSLTEKDVRVDLDTLPEIQTEGTDSDDTAAE